MAREWDDCPSCGYAPGLGDDGLCSACKAEELRDSDSHVTRVVSVDLDYASNRQTLVCRSDDGWTCSLRMDGAVDHHEEGEEVIITIGHA
jgi:hypothetical protein